MIPSHTSTLPPTTVASILGPSLPFITFSPYLDFNGSLDVYQATPSISEELRISHNPVLRDIDLNCPRKGVRTSLPRLPDCNEEKIITKVFDISDLSFTSWYPTESGNTVNMDLLGHLFGMNDGFDNNSMRLGIFFSRLNY